MPKLAIDVEAKFAQVMDGLDNLGRKADQKAKSMSTAFKAVGATLAGIFSVALVKEQLDMFRGTIEQLADLDDAAAMAGTSVEKFSEAWLFLRPTGVEIQDLTGLVQALFKSLGKDGKEGKEVAAALAEVGVAAKDAAGNIRDPMVVLEEFSKGLAKFENDGNKTALIYRVLGRAAGQYIPILEDLAKKQGETASISTDLASKSEELANQFRAIGQIGENLRINFLSYYIDDISTLTTKYLEATRAGAGFVESLANIAAPNFRLDALQASLDSFKKKLEELKAIPEGKTEFEKFFPFAKSTATQIKETEAAIASLTAQIERLYKVRAVDVPDTFNDRRFTGEVNPLGRVKAGGDGGGGKTKTPKETELERISDWLDKQAQQQADLNIIEQTALKIAEAREKLVKEKNFQEVAALDMMEEQLLGEARALDQAKEAKRIAEDQAGLDATISAAADRDVQRIKDLAQSYKDLGDPVQKYLDKLEEINELQAKGLLSSEQGTRARDAINDQIAGLNKLEDKVEEISEFTKRAAQNMQDAFADFLFDPAKDGLDGLADHFEKTLKRMVAEAVSADIMNALLGDYGKTNVIGGILGSLLTGSMGGTGSSTNTTGSTLRAMEGGSDATYGAAVDTKSVQINQTFNVAGGASRADMVRAAQAGKEQAKAEIADSMRRGNL